MESIKPIETYYNGYRFRSRLEARWAVFFDAIGVKYDYEPEGFQTQSGYYLPDFRVKCYGTRGNINEYPFDLWVEVKGNMTQYDKDRIEGFAYASTSDYVSVCPYGYGEVAYDISPHSDYDDHKRRLTCNCGAAFCVIDDSDFEKSIKPYYCFYSDNNILIGDKNMIGYYPKNSVLIVHKIPNIGCSTDSNDCESYEEMNGLDIYPFNYKLIDGDYFAAYPAATKDGRFYLFGDDSNYINKEDVARVEKAYTIARQARFEHGETPRI